MHQCYDGRHRAAPRPYHCAYFCVYQAATKPLPRDVVERIAPYRHPVADTRANLFTYRLDRDNRLISGGMAMIPFGADRMARMIADRPRARTPGCPKSPRSSMSGAARPP